MTLEELKAAMDAAKEKSLANPSDKALQTAFAEAEKAYNDAKAKAEVDPDSDPDENIDEKKLDEKTKAYIAKLRGESAKHRTKAKDLASKLNASEETKKAIMKAAGIEIESDKPEEKIKELSQTTETLAFRNAVLESAVQNGIPGEQVDYFEFLLSKELEKLDEGQELPDEDLQAIVKKVKSAGGKASANSSVTTKDGKKPPSPDKEGDAVSLDDFCRMSIIEKSRLFEKNQDMYEKLVKEAKAKKKLI